MRMLCCLTLLVACCVHELSGQTTNQAQPAKPAAAAAQAAPAAAPQLTTEADEATIRANAEKYVEAYRRLAIAEVWFWRAGVIEVHVLTAGRYQRREVSACLPGLDLALVASLLERPTVIQAVRALRALVDYAEYRRAQGS